MALTDSLSSIPHPPKKPIVGNMLSIDSTSPVQHLARMAKELGPIFWLDMMGAPHRHRLRRRPGRRAERRKALRQGGARRAAPRSRHRRRRAVHGRHHRAELGQGAQHPDAAVRQPRDAVLPSDDGRYRRAAGQEVGTAERRRGDRRRPRHDGADARHHRPVRLRLPLQLVLPPRLPSVRRVAGALARDRDDDARAAARRPLDAQPPPGHGEGRRVHERDGRRDRRRATQERRSCRTPRRTCSAR